VYGIVVVMVEWFLLYIVFGVMGLVQKKYYANKVDKLKHDRVKTIMLKRQQNAMDILRRKFCSCRRFLLSQTIVFGVLFFVDSVSGSILGEREQQKLKIYVSKNDEIKSLEGAFAEDDLPDKEEIWKEKLHFSWKSEEALTLEELKDYVDKMAKMIVVIPTMTDADYDELSDGDKQEVDKLAEKIRVLDKKKEVGLSLEEYELEHKYYMEIYSYVPSADRIFQAARASEDAFWKCAEMSLGYVISLEKAADSISEFGKYVQYETSLFSNADQQY